MRRIDRIVIHCATTPPSMDVCLYEIRAWHTLPPPRGNGWNDVDYAPGRGCPSFDVSDWLIRVGLSQKAQQ